jgi:hypothetical protein
MQLDQVMERFWAGRSIRVDIPNQIRQRRQPQPLDQCAPFPDGRRKFQSADLWKLHPGLLDDSEGIVPATV